MNEKNNANETKTTVTELTDAELEQASGGSESSKCDICGAELYTEHPPHPDGICWECVLRI